jgi:hypothetical protein
MRSLIVMAMFVATLSNAAWNGYTETRDLELSADGVEMFEIDAGAGDIIVNGDPNAVDIKVKALIRVDDDEEGARAMIAKNLVLKLETKRGKAKLDAYFDDHFWHNENAAVDLEVQIPQGLAIFVDDGSGPMHIEGLSSDVGIDDGSGSIVIIGAGRVKIDDGSGSINITSVTGDVMVEDGSGDIKIRDVGGSVTIDDGSGGIDVKNVERDLEIIDDGSGSVRLADIRGAVRQDD